jgi:RNA polymerase sigma factor (sigma-70 family)
MAKGQLKTVLHHMRQLGRPQAAANLSDGELLHCFAVSGEEPAFTALVQRHGPLVLSVCRRVLRHEQDAEDAFQATFLILARRARSVRKGDSLASWLYGVAYRTARHAATDAAKRRTPTARRHLVALPDPPAEASLRELQRLLEDEVTLLPEKLRAPFVLCCLEGHSRAEAARQLGWNEGTLSGRVALARQRLRQRLARRGATLTAALCALALGAGANGAVPGALVGATVQAAMQVAAGQAAGAASVQVISLAEGGLPTLTPTKIRIAALVLLVLAGAGAGVVALQAWAAKPAAAEALQAVGPAAPDVDQPRADRYGDALPRGAVARLGTVRFRPRGGSPWPGNRFSPGIAFLPGDRTLVSLAWGKIDSWDVATGKEVPRSNDPGWSFVNTISPDGKILVAETENSAVHLWDAATGKDLRQLTGRDGWFCDAAFSADGRLLVAAMLVAPQGDQKRPWWAVWETATGKQLQHFDVGQMETVAIAPDGKTVATADWYSSSTVYVRDTATGRKLHTFGPLGLVNKLGFAPDGKTLAALESSESDSKVHLWDVASGKLRTRLKTLDSVSSVAFAPDCKTVASAHRESFHVWDISTGEWVERFEGKGCVTADLAFSGDGKTLATSGNGVIRLWDMATGKEVPPPGDGHRGELEALAFLPDGKTLVTAGADHTLRQWDAATGREIRRFPVVGRADGNGSVAAEGKLLALCADREVCLQETITGKELHRFRYPDFVPHAALTPDGKTLAIYTGGKDLTLRLVDTATGRERLARQYPEFIQQMGFSPAGDVLAADLANGTFLLLDAITGSEVPRLRLSENVPTWAFVPDGKTLATGMANGAVRFWEVATGRERAHLPALNPQRMAFSSGGRVLVLGDRDGTLRLCRATTGQELRRLRGHRSEITYFAFSPDGRTLVSGSWDTTALVWDISDLLEREPAPPGELEARQREALWIDLASGDAAQAYRAIQALAAAPQQALPFVKARLRPVSEVEPKQVALLLANLDSDDFAVREQATADLEKLGESANPALRQALEGKPSLEVRRRVGALLQKLRKESLGPERLRELRALEVLEQIGGDEVRELLHRLADGLPEAGLTQEAHAALERLDRRSR